MRYIETDQPIGYNPAFARAARKKRKKREAELHAAMLIEEAAKARAEIVAKKAMRFIDPRSPIPINWIPKTEFERVMFRAVRIFGKAPKQLKGESRQRDIVFARQFIFYWACRKTGLSLSQVGKLVGGKDHTTALHGCRAYREKRKAMGRNLPVAR